MSKEPMGRRQDRWAYLRFSIVGPLLAAPPKRGDLQAELKRLAAKQWQHPMTEQPVHFGFLTIQRWYYTAVAAKTDPVGVLRRRLRKDSGAQPSLNDDLRRVLKVQYRQHRSWTYPLHFDNLHVQAEENPKLGSVPSYSSVRRYMKTHGLVRKRLARGKDTTGRRRAEDPLQSLEVRSFESQYVHGLVAPGFPSRLPQDPEPGRRVGQATSARRAGRPQKKSRNCRCYPYG